MQPPVWLISGWRVFIRTMDVFGRRPIRICFSINSKFNPASLASFPAHHTALFWLGAGNVRRPLEVLGPVIGVLFDEPRYALCVDVVTELQSGECFARTAQMRRDH